MSARPLDLPDRYVDLGLVGEGAMGQVRRVRDTKLGCELAMKILHPQLAQRAPVVTRFVAEAQLTAILRHPGIVAVHDFGYLDDEAQPWFTMQLVEGSTLRDLVAVVHRLRGGSSGPVPPGRWDLRRLVEALVRVCEAVGYAHTQGVVHRDLKPSNLMVGAFGEVVVMDWGIAKGPGIDPVGTGEALEIAPSRHRTLMGRAVGTPPYMAPEQARGELDEVGPHSDVYALGAVLYKILSGRSPYRGQPRDVLQKVLQGPPPPVRSVCAAEVPAELVAICEAAMSRYAAHRPQNAEGLASSLQAWLDREERREAALAVVEEARVIERELTATFARAEQLQQRLRVVGDGVQSWESAERKRPVWEVEDALAEVRRERRRLEVRYVQRLRAALAGVPDLEPARAALADVYRLRAEQAEESDDEVEAEAALAQLRLVDDGRYAAWIEGWGRLTLHTEPTGAAVEAFRFERRGPRMEAERHGSFGRTPLDAVDLRHGSWLLELRLAGHETVRYPVVVDRLGHTIVQRPGAARPTPVVLPRTGELQPNERYVPAGWFRAGGGEGPDAYPPRRLWVESFAIERTPARLRDWLPFLEHRRRSGASLRREDLCGGRIVVDAAGLRIAEGVDPDLPAFGFTARLGFAWARWRAEVDGLPWRLPHELEWEKAARGADGRRLPWGDLPDPALACVLGSQQIDAPVSVEAFPTDESVFGVRGMAGNVKDLCGNVWSRAIPADGSAVELGGPAPRADDWISVRGGAWLSTPPWYDPSARVVTKLDLTAQAGVRLVRSI